MTSNAAPAFYQTTQDVALGSNAPNFLKNGALAGIAPGLPTDPLEARAIIGSYIYSGKRPYALTWTLGIQHQFKTNYTFEARYVGTKGVNLWTQTRSNIFPQVSPSNYIPTYFAMPSAATLASLGRTLGGVESYIVPGGTADTALERSCNARLHEQSRRLLANGLFRLQRSCSSTHQALFERLLLYCLLYLESRAR